MKKIDLHIHTVQNKHLDSFFEYDSGSLVNYVKSNNLDIIAITNHNLFDSKNFNKIQSDLKEIDVTVFPGIEISLEGGHILVIGDNNQSIISELNTISSEIQKAETNDSYKMSISDFNRLCCKKNLIIIPHYRKHPFIKEEIIKQILDPIKVGEVSSPKDFYKIKKEGSIVPLYFSDIRIKKEEKSKEEEKKIAFSSRSTYINCDKSDFATLKRTIENINFVDLNKSDLDQEFEILNGKAIASTGINVLLGNRSSGKTHTLDELYNSNKNNALYIKQFEITNSCEEKEFEKAIKNSEQQVVMNYFNEFINIFDYIDEDIFSVSITSETDEFITTLKQYAQQSINDLFSKLNLFNYYPLEKNEMNEIEKLVSSVDALLSASKENTKIINKFLSKVSLIKLYNELVKIKKSYYLTNIKIEKTNKILKEISNSLASHSPVTQVKDIKFRNVFKSMTIKRKFNSLVSRFCEKEIINNLVVNRFLKKVKVFRQTNKTKLKSNLGVDSKNEINYLCDKEPFDAYLEAKEDNNIKNKSGQNRYKLFFDYTVDIVNNLGESLSGGQRAEFSLLDKLSNYKKYDFVLIDEMEASFDNPFLNSEIINMLRDIANKCTIFISTHNNNLGVSLTPDYYIYHCIEEKNTDKFQIYYGKSNEKYLSNFFNKQKELSQTLIETMEANNKAYKERGEKYENLNN